MNADYILTKNKYGQSIWINKENHLGQAILEKGIYDGDGVHYIEKILERIDNPICLDIGAHIGNHALVMTKYSKMVYCFEPDDDSIKILNKNVEENHIRNIKIFPFGLSDKNEELTFYRQGSTFVSSLKKDDSQIESLTCKIGDEVIQENHIEKIDFIKIDIEGFEGEALYGLKQSIQHSRPVIIMEWNNDITREKFKKYGLFNTVFSHYRILAISHNHHKHYWGTKLHSQFLRFLYRKIFRKRRIICPFVPEARYANVLLIPQEKISLFDKLL
jgi:FkbM family methyltransferase